MTVIVLAYLGFLLLLSLLGGAGIYHALKFGYPGDKTKVAVLLYLVTVLIVIIASFVVLGTVDPEAV